MGNPTRLYVVRTKIAGPESAGKPVNFRAHIVEAVSLAAARDHVIAKYLEKPHLASARDVKELMDAGVVPEIAE